MAEQCSQTDRKPLYLSPGNASFYRWGPAEQYSQGAAGPVTPTPWRAGHRLRLCVGHITSRHHPLLTGLGSALPSVTRRWEQGALLGERIQCDDTGAVPRSLLGS